MNATQLPFPQAWLTVVITSLACGSMSHATILNWGVPGPSSWFTTTNWSPNGTPTSLDIANINNGGMAMATANPAPVAALELNIGANGGTGSLQVNNTNVQVQSSVGSGVVDSIFATGAVNVVSSGSTTMTDMATVAAGLGGLGDINAGQASAALGATAMATGNITIERVGVLEMTGDFDLGQTSGGATATGHGVGIVRDITTQMSVGGDLDVGQTSAMGIGINSGSGEATIERVAMLSIGMDLDVGQSTGDGRSTGTGVGTISDVDAFSLGDSLDVAKVRALNSAVNVGNGTFTLRNVAGTIGFSALNPGSIEIARVLVSELARGNAVGNLTLDHTDLDVANDVIVGELALGGTDSQSSSQAELHVWDSLLVTRDLLVAARFNNTAGSLAGSLEVRRSLISVGSMLSLNPTSTLQIDIDGTTRATGDGNADEYGALDTDMSVLDGTLAIEQNANYSGPAARGSSDAFQLLTAMTSMTGAFDSVTYDGTAISQTRTYVGFTNDGDDGLFADVMQHPLDVTVTTFLARNGDANGDNLVDGQDFIIWNSHKFTSSNNWSTADFNGDGITDGADFIIWNSNKFTSGDGNSAVPEPACWPAVLLVGWWAGRRA